MKIVLINPPLTAKDIFGDWDLSGVDTYCPPLGLLYIGAFLREHGHSPYIIDANSLKMSLDKLLESVVALDPDVVGITSTTVSITGANRIAEELKGQGLLSPIVLGGPHITAVPMETLEKFSAFDYAVIGEGEITSLELINGLSKNGPISQIQGVVWRDDSGKPIMNPPRPLIKDLDTLPLPAWDLLPNFPDGYPHSALETKRLPAATIITSRGCPHRCTFCDRAVFGNAVRHHSADYTLNLIRELKTKYGIKDLMIVDDNFLLNRKKLFTICDAIIQENLDLSWYCLGHVKYMTSDRLEKTNQAGCWIMEVGIESGCDRILQFIKKNTSKAEIATAVERAKKAGIKVKGNFIFGLPTETLESLEETIQFAKSIDISLFQQTFMTILPGCELSEHANKYGTYQEDWSKSTMYDVSFVPNGLTQDDLLKASKKAFRTFYLRPKIILENILSLTSLRAIRTSFLALAAFLKTMTRKNLSIGKI